MKSAILVFLYAAGSLAGSLAIDCTHVGISADCNKSGLEATTASFMIASGLGAGETSTGPYISLPTEGPKTGGSSFTFPNGSDEYNTNDIINVSWVTDAPDHSIQLNCTLNATGEHVTRNVNTPQAINHGPLNNIDGSLFHLPNGSAICNLCMLDAKGNYLAVSAQFSIRDAGDAEHSSKTWGTLTTSLPTSYTAASLSSTLTHAATSNATMTASSSNSLSTSASSPPTTAPPPNSSTVPTEAATKDISSGSSPDARVQVVVGILAGALALVLLHYS